MATVVQHRPPWRTTLTIVVVGAAAVSAVIGIGRVFGADNSAFPTATKLTPTHLRPTPKPLPPPPVDTASKDSRFIARLTGLAERGGYPLGNPDQLIAAARELCAMVSSGEPLPGASAALMTGYEFGGRQATAVGATAVEVYCPENKR